MFVKRAREGMNDEEAQFSVEVPLEKQTVLWSDKYRPRKPRFFNRVHTVSTLSYFCENQWQRLYRIRQILFYISFFIIVKF